jgi:hypothetical protein
MFIRRTALSLSTKVSEKHVNPPIENVLLNRNRSAEKAMLSCIVCWFVLNYGFIQNLQNENKKKFLHVLPDGSTAWTQQPAANERLKKWGPCRINVLRILFRFLQEFYFSNAAYYGHARYPPKN